VERDGKRQREMEYWSPNVIVEMAALCSALAMENE